MCATVGSRQTDGGNVSPSTSQAGSPGAGQGQGSPSADGRDLRTSDRRGGVPAVVAGAIAGAIAMSLGITAPAHAAVPQKQPVKAKSQARPAARPVAPAHAVAESAPDRYVVVEGDTVSGIAERFGLGTDSVLSLNGLAESALIFPGQVLILSGGATTAAPTTPAASHTVVSGDTVSGIAEAHGLSSAAVLAENGLDADAVIVPGQVVSLPESSPAAHPAETPQSPSGVGSTHVVISGDTVSGIAAAVGCSVQAVLDANGLDRSSLIHPGQVLAVPSGPEPERTVVLTEEMRRNAATIVAVGREAGVGDEGLVIALATAAQESTLRNLTHGDRDSLGLFQQRPSTGWGSPDEVMDPVRASRAFFGGHVNPNPGVTRGLLDIEGWETMTVTEAAQAVQLSAHPGHYGRWESAARAWLAEL